MSKYVMVWCSLLVSSCWGVDTITFTAKVVRVVDGDTIVVLDENKTEIKIRLDGIDAPEKMQDFSAKSKEYLSSLIFGKTITVKTRRTDRYGRILGQIFVDDKDINYEMVKSGMAWHYRFFNRDRWLADAQVDAEFTKIGLWSMDNPIPPWEYRYRQKYSEIRPPEEEYWVTYSSSIIHNSSCRY